MKIKKNTYREGGMLHFYFFKSIKRGIYIGACSELCIVKEEKDLELLKLKTFAAAKEYLDIVLEKKLGEHLLNQELPEEIIEEFVEYIRKNKLKAYQETEIKLQDLRSKSEKILLKCS